MKYEIKCQVDQLDLDTVTTGLVNVMLLLVCIWLVFMDEFFGIIELRIKEFLTSILTHFIFNFNIKLNLICVASVLTEININAWLLEVFVRGKVRNFARVPHLG